MPTSTSSRFLLPHAIRLTSTTNGGCSSRKAPFLDTTCRSSPRRPASLYLYQTATTTAAPCAARRQRRVLPANAFPLLSQTSYVPNHPCVQTEDPLLLRYTVGKRKTYSVTSSRSRPDKVSRESSANTSLIRSFAGEPCTLPAGQYRPPFHPCCNSVQIAHDVARARAVRKRSQDFHALNKCSISPTVKNVRDFSAYRRTLPLKEYRPRNAFPQPLPLPSELDPQHTYGSKNLGGKRFRAVIENRYGLTKMMRLAEKYEVQRLQNLESAGPMKIRMTKAARGHARSRCAAQQPTPSTATTPASSALETGCPFIGTTEQAAPLFKIKRFLQVPPRTCSHRGTCPLGRPGSPNADNRG